MKKRFNNSLGDFKSWIDVDRDSVQNSNNSDERRRVNLRHSAIALAVVVMGGCTDQQSAQQLQSRSENSLENQASALSNAPTVQSFNAVGKAAQETNTVKPHQEKIDELLRTFEQSRKDSQHLAYRLGLSGHTSSSFEQLSTPIDGIELVAVCYYGRCMGGPHAGEVCQTDAFCEAGDNIAPSITAVAIQDVSHKVGDTATATITVDSDSDDYTSGSGGVSGTIAGYTVSTLTKVSETTYTVSFTITDGGTNIAAASTIPVNISLTDSSGNTSSAYTTAISQNNDAIYANLPVVSLSADTDTIAEDGGVTTLTAAVTGSLNNQWPTDITVNLAYGGTATATTDYSKSDRITISAGNTTGTTTVTGVADTLYDAASAETVIVDVSSVSVGTEDGTQQQTISITDAEVAPTVSLSVGTNTVAENGGTASITATLDHATYEDITVGLSYSGTATSGTDFATPSSNITISSGTTSANAATGITGSDDGDEEGAETIIIDVSSVAGGGASENGAQQQIISITDDDDQTAPVFENSAPSVSSATAAGATLSVDLDEESTVYYVVLDDGASTPSAAQVEAGQDAGGNSASVKGSFSTTGTTANRVISGLEDGTDYNVHLVAKDAVGNHQSSPTLVNLTTTNTLPNVSLITVSGIPAVNASSIDFLVTFADEVSNISIDDFTAKLDGNHSNGLAVTNVSSSSGTSVMVTVSVTNVAGAVRLDLNSGSNIVDESGTSPVAFTSGSTHAVDAVPSVVRSVTVPANDIYKEGEKLLFTVNFDESITINTTGGVPQLAVTIGSVTRHAIYKSGNGTASLFFSYAVQSGDNDTDGIAVTALETNGATLQDSVGNNANIALNSIGATTGVLVDTAAPVVASVSSTTANGSYNAGDQIAITVTFNELVTVSGTPQLTLETGDTDRVASYVSGSGTNTLTFNYTVQAGDTSSDLDYLGTSALALNGGTIRDAAGNNATLTLAVPGATGSLGANKAIIIDTAVPAFSWVSTPDADNYYKAGEIIRFDVNLAESGLAVTADLSALDSDFGTAVVLTDDGDGTYSLTTPVLNKNGNMQEGSIAVIFTATDDAGNSKSNDSLSMNLDKTAPTFNSSGSVPVDGATGVTVDDNIVINFSETIKLVNGQTITLFDVSNNAIHETFTASDSTTAKGDKGGSASVASDKITLNPGVDLKVGSEYAVRISASAVQDTAGNAFAGIADNTTFNFTSVPSLHISSDVSEIQERAGSVTYTVSLKDANGDTFVATEAISVQIQFDGTATKGTDYSVSGLASKDEVVISSGTSSATFTVTSLEDNIDDNSETVSATLKSVLAGSAKISNTNVASVTINENTPPSFANLDAIPQYSKGGEPVVIDNDVTIRDSESDALNDGAGNYDGASLSITRSGGANANDQFANNGLLDELIEGQKVVYDGITVGTVTTNSYGTLVLTFNDKATTALVNRVMQNITYENRADEPENSVSLSFTFNDGKANSTGSNEVTATLNHLPVAVNDSYVFTATESGSYTLDVLANDTDADGDTRQLSWCSTDQGSVSIENDVIVLTTSAIGTMNLRYGISDGKGGNATGEVAVTIRSADAQAPTVKAAADIKVNATALFTRVELGVAVATDSNGSALPVSLVDGDTLFEPGVHTVYWRAIDAAGNEGRDSQRVTVNPLVTISKDDVTTEGTTHTVGVYLNGEAPSYPVTIPYTVGGSADASDHNLTDGQLVINSGTEGKIQFTVADDSVTEGTETLEITLSDSLNLGSKSSYTLTILEENVAPEVTVSVSQNGESRSIVDNSDNAVTIMAEVTDANSSDTHDYNWVNDNAQLANISTSDNQFIFNPDGIEPGIYQVKVEVTDSASATVSTDIFIEIVAQLDTLVSGIDTDGDLIPDIQEGLGDSDNDGIPDYKDAISECNVVQEQALESQRYLVEGEPGVCLRKGVTLADNQTGGIQLLTTELTSDSGAKNIGGVFDFVAYGLPTPGQSYQIVFPQRLPVPAGAVYRKFSAQDGTWRDFVEDSNNYVSSAQGEEGYCPPPGDSHWTEGLTEGHWCVQLTVTDGGANDDDGQVNGSIVDPGGVATTSNNKLPKAVNDTVYVAIDGSVTIDVISNDSDADNDTLSVVSASATFGSATIDNGMINYTAASGFYGTDMIRYSISDGNGGTAYADVTVNVSPSAGGVINNSAGSTGAILVLMLGALGVMRRYGHKAGVVLLVLLSFNSQADWFVDADVGFSDADNRTSAYDSAIQSRKTQDLAWSVGLGYQLDSRWAITGRYIGLGEGSATLTPDTGINPSEYHARVAKVTPVLAKGIAADISYALIAEEKGSINAILGGFAWEADFDSEYKGTHISSSEDGVDPYIGLGVDYHLNKEWRVGCQFTRYFIDLNDVTTLTLGLSYQFGG